MTDMQNKELSFVVIERQLIGWHPIVNIVNAWLNAQCRCNWFSSSTRLERQKNLAIISIKMMVHVVFTDDVYFDSWSWESFVSTCDVFNCLLPLDVQNEIQLAAIKSQEPLLVMASLFIGFLVEKYVACRSRKSDFGMASFSFFTLLDA